MAVSSWHWMSSFNINVLNFNKLVELQQIYIKVGAQKI
jgi:hypothetical protein